MISTGEVLARFRPASWRVRTVHGEHSGAGEGGGLQEEMEQLGTGLLVGLLHADPHIQGLVLEDGGIVLSLERNGVGAHLEVQWPGGEQLTERLPLEPCPELAAPNKPRFLPDPASRGKALELLADPGLAVYACHTGEGVAWFSAGTHGDGPGALPLLASLPASGGLGASSFRERFGVSHNLVGGAMAGAIASIDYVTALAEAGFLAFYGAGGVPLEFVDQAVHALSRRLGNRPWGANLLHNPNEPDAELAVARLYADAGVRIASASAFMGLTPAILVYRYSGVGGGAPRGVFAKVSRPEVAKHFLAPPPGRLLGECVQRELLTEAEAARAAALPVADAITCEADSGGHTDSRSLPVLVPLIRRQVARFAAEQGWADRGISVSVGAAGGIGTPAAIASALALGADYVLCGSVLQATAEAGTSRLVKEMLAEAGMADVAKGPAPDMFELGAEVQVLSRGSLYAQRSKKLHGLYKGYASWGEVPEQERAKVERTILGRSFDEVWGLCEQYWGERDPAQLERAKTDGRHKMALAFRWYLGMTSRWARQGEADRKRDFQIWCGPSMGAFNDWAAGSTLEDVKARSAVGVSEALLTGALLLERGRALAAQGLEVPSEVASWRP